MLLTPHKTPVYVYAISFQGNGPEEDKIQYIALIETRGTLLYSQFLF